MLLAYSAGSAHVTTARHSTRSTIAVTPASLIAGQTGTISFIAVDAYGNAESSGLPVQFVLGTGSASGNVGAVSYQGNGIYTASFQATTAGMNTITATINDQAAAASSAAVKCRLIRLPWHDLGKSATLKVSIVGVPLGTMKRLRSSRPAVHTATLAA